MCKDHKDLREVYKVCKVCKDLLGLLDLRGLQVYKDPKVLQDLHLEVLRVQPERRVLRDLLVLLRQELHRQDPQDHKVHKVVKV